MYALYIMDAAILCVAAFFALRLQIINDPPWNRPPFPKEKPNQSLPFPRVYDNTHSAARHTS